MSETLAKEQQRFALGPKVELYIIDASHIDGPVYYFVNEAVTGGVSFDGQVYSPFPIKTSDWEITSQGSLPRPKVSVANVNGLFSMLNLLYNDLLGTTVTRIRTYKRFLDGQSDADPLQRFPLDIYKLEQKTRQDDEVCSWDMRASMDIRGKQLPGRKIIQGWCSRKYRRYVNGSFVYGSCPYAGSSYFTKNNQPTSDPAQDRCSKLLTGCSLRFVNTALPTWAFPGVDRTST